MLLPNCSHYLAALLIILRLAVGAYPPIITYCSDNNYTESSPYELNLRRLISELVYFTPVSPSYFSPIKWTTSPNIYGLGQCRPDISPGVCAGCLNHSASIAPKPNGGCPLKTSGFLRYDICLLIYSDKNFYTTATEHIFVFEHGRPKAPSVSFSRDVQTLMNTVISSAAESALRFAVANASADAADIYAMGWCSMDLTTDNCLQCLHNVLDSLPAGKNGGSCSTVSCVVRFETYQFYSDFVIHAELPAENNNNKTMAAPPGVSGTVAPENKNNNNKTKAVIMVASIAIAFLLLFTL